MKFEQGTWTEWHPAIKLPDSDTTVLVFSPKADEPVWLGYHDGEAWRTAEGERYATPVDAWAEIPYPEEKRTTETRRARGKKTQCAPCLRGNSPSFLEEMTTPAFAITPAK